MAGYESDCGEWEVDDGVQKWVKAVGVGVRVRFDFIKVEALEKVCQQRDGDWS